MRLQLRIAISILLISTGCKFRSGYTLVQTATPGNGLQDVQEGQGLGETDPNDDSDEVGVPLPPEGPVIGDEDPLEKVISFFMESTVFDLAHDDALRWDGCEKVQRVPGGYNSDTKCGRAFLHPSFTDHLEEYFFPCVQMAAEKAGINKPARVFMKHLGTYNDRPARNSNRLSMHAYARAMDISNFNLYDAQGNLTRISTHISKYAGATAVFYDEFRACWRESMPSSCVPGNTEYRGSIGHTASDMGGNSLHADHIHLSYPLCGKNALATAGHEHDEEVDELSEENVVALNSYSLPDQKGQLEVVVRDDGHLLGKPLIVQLRPNCGSLKRAVQDLHVMDMVSACDVDLSSMKLSKDGHSLRLKIRDIDGEDFNQKSMESMDATPQCGSQYKQVSFDLKKFCQ